MLKNHRGISLVQVIMAMGMIGGIALVVMQLAKVGQNTTNQIAKQNDLILLTKELQRNLAPGICKHSLVFSEELETGSTAAEKEIDVTQFYETLWDDDPSDLTDNKVLYDVNDELTKIFGKVNILKLTLFSEANTPTYSTTIPNHVRVPSGISLRIYYQYGQKGSNSSAFEVIPLTMVYDSSLDDQNNIIDCTYSVLPEAEMQQLCLNIANATWNSTEQKCEINESPIELLGGMP